MYRFFTLIILAIFFISCEKTDENTTLVGKWALVATLNDPGDGSGQWQTVSEDSDIELFADGSVKTHNFSDFQTYRVIDSVRIEFTSADNARFNYRYRLQGRLLELNPPCIEPCGLRFKRKD